VQVKAQRRNACYVAIRPREAADQTARYRIWAENRHDRDGRGQILEPTYAKRAVADDDVRRCSHSILRHALQELGPSFGEVKMELD
jgi:hypothetical protein